MISTLRKLYELFTPRERCRLGLYSRAYYGVCGSGRHCPIMSFLSIVSDPEIIQQNEILSWFYNTLGFQSSNRFLFWMGVAVLTIITLSNTFAAITMWGLYRFSWMRNHTFSKRLLKKYLHNPYSFFLDRQTYDFGRIH